MAETSSHSNYSYLNARLRGMKSELFTADELGRMLQTGDENGLIRILEKSDYGVDMAESFTRYSGLQAIEEAISRNLFRTYGKMLSLATGHCRELVEILLGRWDIYNIKTILRGIFCESGSERILGNIFPAGRLERPLLKELARQSEIKGFLDMLTTWNVEYVEPLSNNLKQYLRNKDLATLEYALDSFYFQTNLEGLGASADENHQQLQKVLAAEIDIINVMTTLRTVSEGIGAERGEALLLTHGTLEREFLLALLECEKPVDILEKLERTQYAYAVEKGILLFGETGNISIIEKFLEEIHIRKCVKMFYRGSPLGISVAIGYIWLKRNEFLNIRLIARGLAHGMPVNAIREELVLV